MSYSNDNNDNNTDKEIQAQTKHKTKMMGRPKIPQLTRDLVIRLYNEDEMSCKDIAIACNISIASLYSIIREWRQDNAKEEKN